MHMKTLAARKMRLAWSTILLLGSGCALEHPSVSVDSISKRPFFGVQVAPKKKEGPVYDRAIVQDRPVETRTADAGASKSVSVQTALLETESDRRWGSWLPLPSSKPTIPLPRTD